MKNSNIIHHLYLKDKHDVEEHWEFESYRGVKHISAMEKAMHKHEKFKYHSPSIFEEQTQIRNIGGDVKSKKKASILSYNPSKQFFFVPINRFLLVFVPSKQPSQKSTSTVLGLIIV